jgi:hypothetical protein
MGAVPARCWKELAESPYHMLLIYSPTHCRDPLSYATYGTRWTELHKFRLQ